jgi:aryl-alcohol dehydrogenase-like predicted oxidoreductase
MVSAVHDPAMIKRHLPHVDQPISAVGLGCFAIGGFMWGDQSDEDSLQAMAAACAEGLNWIDTAPLYGEGHAERLLGRFLKDLPADERPLVATKFGHVVEGGERVRRAGHDQVIADCELGLRNLGVETIDLFQLHWPAPEPIAETAVACQDLLDAGKIRGVGVSNFSVDQLDEWQATGVPLASVQNPYSLFKRPDEETVLPWCAEHGVAYLAYSPLHRGMLFGTWGPDKTFPAGDHRAKRPDFVQPRLGCFLDAIDALRPIAEEADLSIPQLAVGALLSREGCTSVIVGARNAEQGAALGDLGMPLKTKTLEAIDTVLGELDTALSALSVS